jgi:hypothetical protein
MRSVEARKQELYDHGRKKVSALTGRLQWISPLAAVLGPAVKFRHTMLLHAAADEQVQGCRRLTGLHVTLQCVLDTTTARDSMTYIAPNACTTVCLNGCSGTAAG